MRAQASSNRGNKARPVITAAMMLVGGALALAFRIRDRQRPQHHGMDQREDGSRAADPKRERQDGRGGEDGRETELTDRVTDGADRIVHADRLDGMDPPSVDPYRMLDDYARTTSNKIRLGAWRRARPLATTVRYLPCSSCFASSARIGDRSPGPRAGPRAIPVRSPRGDAGTEIPNPTAFDRHRGRGCPPTPATPPCVRVRTRRFESVALSPVG